MTSVDARKNEKESGDSETFALEQRKTATSEVEDLGVKLEQIKEDLLAEQKKTAELATRMKYLQADLINVQRHEDRLVAETRMQVKISWLMEIVSIKEDLDRALKIVDKSQNSSLARGLELVNSRIEGVLKSEEVKPIQAEMGKNFDPHIHEAVAFQDSDVHEQGKITSLISQGYTVGGKVVKPALVEVARRKESKHEKKISEKKSVQPGEMTIQEESGEGTSPQL